MDPADDQTLPRLIEALKERQRVRQLMSEQLNNRGTQPSYPLLAVIHVALDKCIYLTFCLRKHHFMSLRAIKLLCMFSSSQHAEVHASAAGWSAQCEGDLPSRPAEQTEREGKNHQQPEIGDRATRKKVQNLRIQGAAKLSPEVLHTYGVANRTNIVFVCPLAQVDILQRTTEMYEQDKRSLQHELESREQRLQKELTDRRRVEHRMQGVVSDTNAKWEKECVSKLSDLDREGIQTDVQPKGEEEMFY